MSPVETQRRCEIFLHNWAESASWDWHYIWSIHTWRPLILLEQQIDLCVAHEKCDLVLGRVISKRSHYHTVNKGDDFHAKIVLKNCCNFKTNFTDFGKWKIVQSLWWEKEIGNRICVYCLLELTHCCEQRDVFIYFTLTIKLILLSLYDLETWPVTVDRVYIVIQRA